MIKPLIWMFKVENFKEHYLKLLFNYIKYIIIAFLLMCLCVGFKSYMVLSFVFLCASIICFFIPFFLSQGYFWELTDEAINRDYDLTASNVYDGRLTKIFKIRLPEWNSKKFIWRGVASIVATIILYVPIVAMFLYMVASGNMQSGGLYSIPIFSIYSFDVTPIILWCFLVYFIVPAFLWNYAKRNSVISVLNLRAAIYLIGNYPATYFMNALCFIIYAAIDFFIMSGLVKVFFDNGVLASGDNLFGLLLFAILFLIWVVKYLYTIFVCAYLLGTIADTGDGLGKVISGKLKMENYFSLSDGEGVDV